MYRRTLLLAAAVAFAPTLAKADDGNDVMVFEKQSYAK